MIRKILIVDDATDIVDPISILLTEAGYLIDTTTNGNQVQRKVLEFKPDLILLDVLISGSDGREICKYLKKEKITKNIPIVMMSAHPDAKQDSIKCRADNFISKPFNFDTLLLVIDEYIH